VAPLLDEVFMPLTRATFAILRSDVNPAEMSTLEDHALLRRAYMEFLNVIVTHGLQNVLVTERNVPHTPEILAAVLEGSGVADPKGYKICYGMFR
jgi:hypothetical protein